MKITVWGGSGFLGSHVCDELSNNNHEVIIADRKESDFLRKDQKMFIGDITNKQDVLESCKDSDVVFNFAGIAGLDESNHNLRKTVDVNIVGNVNLLESCNENKVSKYVFASSLYVYSNSGGYYKFSKQSSELLIDEFYNQKGLDFLILRFGSLYGTRSDESNGIHRYLNQAMNSNKIIYNGNEASRREYIHVEDAARMCLELLAKEHSNKYYTISGSQSLNIKDLFLLISEVLDKKLEFQFNEDNENGHYKMSPYHYNPKKSWKYTSKINHDLGQGLMELIEYLDNNKS
tara:strand:+ start:9079 stop:9948 length:870 start_codon:yes stop_codon:yes gene_type:complete